MKLIVRIAFRNLFRRKSRGILLGSGIFVAVVYMILVNALTEGLYSNVINKMVESNVMGHLTLSIVEKDGSTGRAMVRDKEAMISMIKRKMPNIKNVRESVSTYVFAIGNGYGNMLKLGGINLPSIEKNSDISVISGDIAPFIHESVEFPLILEKNRAKELKVRPGDIVKVKLNTVYGQVQTAQLSLVAIVEYKNPFMNAYMPGALPLHVLKEIMGFRQNETQKLNIELKTLKDSDEMILAADQLHGKFLSGKKHPGTDSLTEIWKLAERTYSQTDHEKKQREIRRASYKGSILDIASMQEFDEDTFKGEKGAATTGFFALLIVTSIILVGILNTTRMNVRERMDEIGTVRAIGMQRKTVVQTLVTEVFLLSIISVLLGIAAAYGLMELISIIQFHPGNDSFLVFIRNGHLALKVSMRATLFNILLVFFLIILATWLPARKATRKSVAQALGHYE